MCQILASVKSSKATNICILYFYKQAYGKSHLNKKKILNLNTSNYCSSFIVFGTPYHLYRREYSMEIDKQQQQDGFDGVIRRKYSIDLLAILEKNVDRITFCRIFECAQLRSKL